MSLLQKTIEKKCKLVFFVTIFDPIVFVIILEVLLEEQCSEESFKVVVVWFIEESHAKNI